MKAWAKLIPTSAFAGIFANGCVPVRTASPTPVLLEHGTAVEMEMAFFLDETRCSDAVLLRISEAAANRFADTCTADELHALARECLVLIARHGLPIRESQVERMFADGEVPQPGVCTRCGCTDHDCSTCIERTGEPCRWVNAEHTLCSACAEKGEG